MAFTFWKNKKDHVFDITKYWDDQNRIQLKERYDHREGAFDWDLQMKLREYGAKQICPQEYKHWRETGVAFTFPEFESTLPNKTFAMDLKKNGNQWFHRGYVGDMTVGPYIPFGIECVEDKMLKSTFGTNQCRATDITERNVYETIFEIENGRRFDEKSDKKTFRQYGAVKLQVGDAVPTGREFEDANLNLAKFDKPLKSMDNVKIHFMSVEDVLNITKKHQFKGKFDIAFIANNYFSFLKPDFIEILSPNSLLLFETKKYSTFKQSEINEGIHAIKTFCKDLELQPITSFALNIVNSLLKFKKIQ
jgi:dynein assembly factor 3, axonemal